MGLENGDPKRDKTYRMPEVFDREFALPDTPFVEFMFSDRESVDELAEAFSETHVGEFLAINQEDLAILTSRRGDSDTARLFLNFLHKRADEGFIEKHGVKVRGLNKMPE